MRQVLSVSVAEPKSGGTTEPTGPAAQTSNPSGRHRRRALIGSLVERFSIVGVWIIMIGVYWIVSPHQFMRTGTFHTIFASQQALVFLALALTCAFVVDEFDLSVASILGLSATLVPVLYVLHHVNIGLSIVIALLASIVAGAFNGFLVVVVGVNPIVVTLGSGTLLLGVALGLSNLEAIGGLPTGLANVANQPFLGLPVSFYYGLVLAAVLTYTLRYTPLGRSMVFVGSNREVARLAGINVNRIRFGAYVASGTICGIGGIIAVCGVGGFDPSVSQTYLLPGFSAVFLGTAIVSPGRFNPPGTMIAIYFLVTGIIGLQIIGFAGWISQVFYGGALVVAVSVSALVRRSHVSVPG